MLDYLLKRDNFALPFKMWMAFKYIEKVVLQALWPLKIIVYSDFGCLLNIKNLRICLAVKKEKDIRSLHISERSV